MSGMSLAVPSRSPSSVQLQPPKSNQVGTVVLYGVPIVSLMMDNTERLCLAQISNTLLKDYSYNEIHNRRVALGITCVQCTPVQLEMLRRAGAMPVSSRRCGMITRREAERLCKSFLGDNSPPRLPEDFAFAVHHNCAWGCQGAFIPSRYNSSRAKCIKCTSCGLFFSPNKFIFHSHRTGPAAKYVQPDAANFNSWRRHMKLSGTPPDEVVHAWEDVKAMFNGGTRKRLLAKATPSSKSKKVESPPPAPSPAGPRVPPLPLVMDYVWGGYPLPWLHPSPLLLERKPPSAFTPVYSSPLPPPPAATPQTPHKESDSEETVDIETCPEDDVKPWTPHLPKPEVSANKDDDSSPQSADTGSRSSTNEVRDMSTTGWRFSLHDPPRPMDPLYGHQLARHLHLMRGLVSPGRDAAFPPNVQTPPRSENADSLSPVDCSACHQMYPSPILQLSNSIRPTDAN